jgi:hypothetical protein
VEAGLSYDDRPIRMSAARLSENVQYAMLNRIRHLHHDQQEV